MDDRFYLERALANASQAAALGQIPVGCVIVDENDTVIGSQHNQTLELNDKTAHAEMLAIREAMLTGKGGLADGWTAYTTLEPCPMCLSAIILCRIRRVVWAAADPQVHTSELLQVLSYQQKNNLSLVATPFEDLRKRAWQLYNEGRNRE